MTADPVLVEKFRRLLTGEVKGYSPTAWEELAAVAARHYEPICTGCGDIATRLGCYNCEDMARTPVLLTDETQERQRCPECDHRWHDHRKYPGVGCLAGEDCGCTVVVDQGWGQVSSCPKCGHKPHGEVCLNMASDNDCACKAGTS